MVKRHLEDIIQRYLFKNKTVIIFGARQVGKTTIVNEIIRKQKTKVLFLNGDDADTRDLFSAASASKLKPVLENYKLLCLMKPREFLMPALVLR